MPSTYKTIITPRGLSLRDYWQDMYRYRRVLTALSYRSIRSKYAQTAMGFLWVVINPLLSLLILGFVFGKVAKLDTQGIDPFLFTMAGLICWTYFANVVSAAGVHMVGSANLVKKIYFPKAFIPLSVVTTVLVELLVLLVMALIMFLLFGYKPSLNLLYYPLVLIVTFVLTTGFSLSISAAIIRYRDFQQVVPFITRLGLYATPVAYSVQHIDPHLRNLFLLNPMTGIMETSRWCFFGGSFPTEAALATLAWLVLIWVIGIFYFRKVEKSIADLL